MHQHWCMTNESPTTFVSIRDAAGILGVPLAWMRSEAASRRVPVVRAGRRWLVPLKRTQALLHEWAEGGRGEAR